MHEAVDVLESAIPTTDPAEVYSVTHKSLASAIKVIARADDSNGIIGDACRRLLDLHPQVAASAKVPAGRLVDWMMKFQFGGDVDYFEIDIVAHAPVLGESGMATCRTRLKEIEAGLGPRPSEDERWTSPHAHEGFTLDWNAQRLAVLDRDVDEIIRTHAKDRTVAAWLEDTAEAFEEIGEIDLAIDWAKQATDFGRGHQSLKGSRLLVQAPRRASARRIVGGAASGLPALALVHDGSAAPRRRGNVLAGLPRRGHRDARIQSERCRAVRPAHPQGRSIRMEPRPLPATRQRPHLE